MAIPRSRIDVHLELYKLLALFLFNIGSSMYIFLGGGGCEVVFAGSPWMAPLNARLQGLACT